jgi:hypothetical protein
MHPIWLVAGGFLSGVLSQRLGTRLLRSGYAGSLAVGGLRLMRVLLKSLTPLGAAVSPSAPLSSQDKQGPL